MGHNLFCKQSQCHHPLTLSRVSCIILSINKLNKIGDNTHILDGHLWSLQTLMRFPPPPISYTTTCTICRSTINLTTSPSIPEYLRMLVRACFGTESNAFERSTKQICKLDLCSTAFSMTCRSTQSDQLFPFEVKNCIALPNEKVLSLVLVNLTKHW